MTTAGDDLVERVAAMPRRAAVGYLLTASAWIVVSDLSVHAAVGPPTSTPVNIAKGLVFVAVTTAALHLVLRRLAGQVVTAVRSRERSGRRFQALIEKADDLIVVVDVDERITYVSPSFRRVLGFEPDALIGEAVSDLLHPDDVTALRARRTRFAGTPTPIRVRHAEEGWRYLEAIESNHFDDPSIRGVVINARDVSPQIATQQQLAWALHHDVLTGLPNRAEFEQRLGDAAQDLEGTGGCVVVVVGDLDAFRRVNAVLDRAGGDQVLREVARRLQAVELDALGRSVLIGRLGSDQFGLAISMDDDDGLRDRMVQVMEQVRLAVQRPMSVRGIDLRLSMSCGAGTVRERGSPFAGIADAESALREAKGHLDRTAIAVAGAAATTSSAGIGLHDALRRGQMLLHYQPQMDLRTRRIVGVEGLLRWSHPTRGVLGPGEFLDSLEAEGLMGEVTRFVLLEGARAARALHDRGHDIRVSINLSLKDLSRRHIVEEAAAALEGGVDAAWMRLELTEQALLVQPDVSLRTMQELRDMGYTFAIDDFGTGYSSLAHLRLLPVQELKIDRSFAAAVEEPINRAIVATICRLASELGLITVAEGVPDEDGIAALVALGCDVGQSYHLGRPATLEALGLLRERTA